MVAFAVAVCYGQNFSNFLAVNDQFALYLDRDRDHDAIVPVMMAVMAIVVRLLCFEADLAAMNHLEHLVFVDQDTCHNIYLQIFQFQ